MQGSAVAFALIYLTFFLDNVLLTVLVPIIPDWVRGDALALWAAQDAPPPLAGLLNHTVSRITHHQLQGSGSGASQAVVGLVLGAKAAAQLVTAPFAGAGVARRGAAPVLRAATAALAAAALGFAVCSGCEGAGAALCVCAARVTHGAGAALAGVAGLALAAQALPDHARHRGIGALLGAVALGVLVGYPFGGAADALWNRRAPFLLIAVALLANLAMQYMFLDTDEYNRPVCSAAAGGDLSALGAVAAARRGAAGACAGCVLLTTSVMAALEPCLPLWLATKFHPEPWQTGVVFVPDSVGYFLAASGGGLAKRIGAERVALTGQVAVGVAALCVPLARSVAGLALPHLVLGLGLGAADAALVPALLARGGRRAPALAALLQAAGSAAYALGPVLGGLLAAAAGFDSTLRTLAILNLLYAAYLYTRLRAYPLSEQWGASAESGAESDDEASDAARSERSPLAPLGPLAPSHYTQLD